MNFSFLNSLTPRTRVPPFLGGGGGGGVKTSLRIAGAVCEFGPGSRATFFLYMDPLTYGGGRASERRVPRVTPSSGPLLVRTSIFTLNKAV